MEKLKIKEYILKCTENSKLKDKEEFLDILSGTVEEFTIQNDIEVAISLAFKRVIENAIKETYKSLDNLATNFNSRALPIYEALTVNDLDDSILLYKIDADGDIVSIFLRKNLDSTSIRVLLNGYGKNENSEENIAQANNIIQGLFNKLGFNYELYSKDKNKQKTKGTIQ